MKSFYNVLYHHGIDLIEPNNKHFFKKEPITLKQHKPFLEQVIKNILLFTWDR